MKLREWEIHRAGEWKRPRNGMVAILVDDLVVKKTQEMRFAPFSLYLYILYWLSKEGFWCNSRPWMSVYIANLEKENSFWLATVSKRGTENHWKALDSWTLSCFKALFTCHFLAYAFNIWIKIRRFSNLELELGSLISNVRSGTPNLHAFSPTSQRSEIHSFWVGICLDNLTFASYFRYPASWGCYLHCSASQLFSWFEDSWTAIASLGCVKCLSRRAISPVINGVVPLLHCRDWFLIRMTKYCRTCLLDKRNFAINNLWGDAENTQNAKLHSLQSFILSRFRLELFLFLKNFKKISESFQLWNQPVEVAKRKGDIFEEKRLLIRKRYNCGKLFFFFFTRFIN